MTDHLSKFGALPEDGAAAEFLSLLERFGGAGYWSIDLESEEIFWSERVCQMHGVPSGYRPESVAAVVDFYHTDDQKIVKTAVRDSIAAGVPFHYELRIIRPDGGVRWIESNGEVRCDDADNPTAIVGTFRDVTERVESDAELRRAAVFHESVVSAINEMDDAFVIFDAEDRLYLCNDAYRKLYPQSASVIRPGVKFEEILRYGLEHGQYPEAIGTEGEWLAERMRHHINPTGPIEQQLTNNRWVRIHEIATRHGQRVGIRIDITKMKDLEARLHDAAREALSANQLKDRFMANMSHELRTPLNAIIGFSQVIELLAEQDEAHHKVGEYASDIVSAGEHLLGVIEDIFSLAQMEAGAETVRLEAVPVHEILDDVQSLTRTMATQRGKDIAFEDGVCMTLPVAVDKVKMAQVLVNLVSNAIKYSGDGEIAVRAIPGETGYIVFEVSDEGPGIALDVQDRIFDRFERLDVTKQAIEGIGIGLAIAKDLVAAMHGEIGVDSVPGEGATFWVSIPLATGRYERAAS